VKKNKDLGGKSMTIEEAFALAVQHHQSGRLSEAESCYKKILALQPDHTDALHHWGVIAYQTGNFDSAIDLIKRSLALKPENAQAVNSLGGALKAKDQMEEAITCFHRALKLNPNFPEAHNNLGNALQMQGRVDDAISCFEKAISLKPELVEAHFNLAVVYHAQGKLERAIKGYKEALAYKKDYPAAHYSLGNALYAQGNFIEAGNSYQQLLALTPDNADAYNKLGIANHAQGKLEEAIQSYKRALSLAPNLVQASNNMGCALCEQGELEEAVVSFNRALKLKPDYAEAHCNLGNALKEQGLLEEAISSYRRTIALKPNYTDAYSNLLLTLHYSTQIDSNSLFKEHLIWAERFNLDSVNNPRLTNSKEPERRLKIGYLSPDFRSHSIAYFLEPIFGYHDKKHFEIYCYSAVMRPDETTQRLKSMADHWISVIGLSIDQIISQIRNDEIDILIDLVGHTGKNYLSVFAQKPAPVQVSYLGYPNTTGLNSIDYRLTDAYADPPGETEKWHTEQLTRLEPSAWTYRPFGTPPPLSELPASNKGFITFGSFNSFPKFNQKVYQLWGRILLSVVDSQLVLKTKSLGNAAVRKRVYDYFTSMGIKKDRIILLSHETSYNRHLERYHDIDIALDPFPYHGTTTTCEALYMGVPVITLEGEAHRSRVGVSLLNQVELQHLIAKNEEDYVTIACSLAADLGALADLRKTLRSRMEMSPLMDEVGFTRELENAYREMWKKWASS